MVEQNCKILIVFLLLLNCTIESRYWSGEGEMVQEIKIPENEMVGIGGPLFYLGDQRNTNMKSFKRSGTGNIRLLRKKNEPKVGIRLLQI